MRQSKLVFWIPRLVLLLLSVYVLTDSVSVLMDGDDYRINDGFGDAIMSFLYTIIVIVCVLLLLLQKHAADLVAAIALLIAILLSMTIPNGGRFYLLSIVTSFYSVYALIRLIKKLI